MNSVSFENQDAVRADLLKFEQVSGQVSFGRSRIYQLIAEGDFPAPIKVGKSSRWLRVEIDAWIEEQAAQRTGA